MVRIGIENHIVEQRLCGELDALKIPYTVKRNQDSAYGALFEMTDGHGWIELREQDQATVAEILDNLRSDLGEAPRIETTKKRNSDLIIFVSVAAALVIVVCVLALQLHSLKREYALLTSSNAHSYEWDATGTQLTVKRLDGSIAEIDYDQNRNDFFEKMMNFDRHGRVRTISVATKDNGNYDSFQFFDAAGTLIQEDRTDADGVVVHRRSYYGNDRSIEWSSAEGNGVLDRLRLHGGGAPRDRTIDDVFSGQGKAQGDRR